MIAFIDKPELANYTGYNFPGRPIIVMNLSSLYSGHIDITDLITKISPINNTGLSTPDFVNSVQFDMMYMGAIMNDPNLFHKLMMIMLHAHEGYLVNILVQRDWYRDAVMESLIKLIQQRYGYNCWIIEEPEDVMYIKNDVFTPSGLLTLDSDIHKYNELYSSGRVDSILQTISME